MCQTLTHVQGVFDRGKHHRGMLGRREKEGSRLRSGRMLFRALFVWQGITLLVTRRWRASGRDGEVAFAGVSQQRDAVCFHRIRKGRSGPS